MSNNRPLILIIDDEPAILKTLKAALEDENCIVETLADGSKVLEMVGQLVPDLVLLDIFIPKYNGLDLLSAIKKEYPSQKVIIISGYGTIPIAIDAIKKGALDFIEKPLNLDEILTKIAFLKDHNHTHFVFKKATPQAYSSDCSSCGIVGASALFCELVHHASLIAPIGQPVLIYGPSGSGKSMMARYIHVKSHHVQEAFNVITCTTLKHLPENINLMHGTLFFKNIHELSSVVQKELLDYLTGNHGANQRIIASSMANLFTLVHNGLFNPSLFCKLNVTPIEIPSINKRRYDIPLLVDCFLNEANTTYNKNITLTPAAIRFLRNHFWVGDIAQIKSLIDITVKTTKQASSNINVDELLALIPGSATEILEEQEFSRFNSLQQATEKFQQHYLMHLLKLHRYDTTQLAEFLQIPVAKLYDTMIKLHINHI